MAGGLTGNEVIACQPTSSLLYQKITMSSPPVGARMPLDGPPFLAPAQIDTVTQWMLTRHDVWLDRPNQLVLQHGEAWHFKRALATWQPEPDDTRS